MVTDEATSFRASFPLLILLQDIGRENSFVFKTFPSVVLNYGKHMLHLLPKRWKKLELT